MASRSPSAAAAEPVAVARRPLVTELALKWSAGVGAAPSRPGGLDRFVAAIAVGQVVSWGVLYYAFSVLVVPMQRQLGWPRPVLVGGFTVAGVISGLLATTVGRHLDHGSPRLVMGGGSFFAVVVVVAWSQARSVPAYYLAWAGIGVAMVLVLYEPAFTVIAKRYAPHHHRPLMAVTLVAGIASFVFQPLTSTLASAHGWRIALLLLAGVLAVTTLPIHSGCPPGHRPNGHSQPARPRPGA